MFPSSYICRYGPTYFVPHFHPISSLHTYCSSPTHPRQLKMDRVLLLRKQQPYTHPKRRHRGGIRKSQAASGKKSSLSVSLLLADIGGDLDELLTSKEKAGVSRSIRSKIC